MDFAFILMNRLNYLFYKKSKGYHKGSFLVVGAIIILAVIAFFVIVAGIAMFADLQGEKKGNDTTGSKTGAIDCSGVTRLTTEQYQWVKDAAAEWLKSDEAAIIALIQIESGWRADAKNPGSSAAGLGQFITSTARGYKEFVGGNDSMGTTWPSGTVYDNPASHPDDARFEAKRSIYAIAHKMNGHMKQYGWDLGKAYEYGYHTHGNGDPSTVAAAQAARKRLEETYDKLINGGGCKAISSGKACGITQTSNQFINKNSAKIQLMPPAARDFNALAEEFYKTINKKAYIVSMFRTRQDQIDLCGSPTGPCKSSLVNPPGASMHEAGLAFDLGLQAAGRAYHKQGVDAVEYEQFKQIATKHGWQVNSGSRGRFGAGESWHFDYIRLKDQYWYGAPKITNAIAAANNTNCQ